MEEERVRARQRTPFLPADMDFDGLGSYVVYICAYAHARAHHCTTQEPSTQGPKTPDLANVFINETRLLALIGKQFILFKFAGSAYIQYVLVAHS